MIEIKKRNGDYVAFDSQRIINAVNKAFKEVRNEENNEVAQEIADQIYSFVKGKNNREVDVEHIQDFVEDLLMEWGFKDVARAYIRYRYKKEILRKANTTDKDIKELLNGENDYWNNENSNKNAKRVTVQRDYMAGIVSTDITRRFLLDKDIVEAHDQGIIHFHDADYFAQNAITNCFRGDEKFITKDGVRSFCSYIDGEEVIVPTHTGEWKKAKVKKYGVQKINKVTLKRGGWTEKIVYVTPNHRWFLKNGEVTTNLKIGDYLLKTPILNEFDWEELSQEEKMMWAKGFAYGDGRAIQFAHSWYSEIRLCGEKNRYIPLFEEIGLNITYPSTFNGDASIKLPGYNKNEIPTNMTLEEKKAFVYGFLCADGSRTTLKNNGNSYNEFKMVQVTGSRKVEQVYDLLNSCGYYVSKISDLTGQVTNYGQRTDVTKAFYFQANQTYRNWRVIDIQPAGESEVWCLEVEDDHSFILEKGVVTGNCELINLEDMLQNGTVVNGVLIEKPHRLITATTIATQIIAAVTSATYGGATISLTHLAPFVKDSYNYYLKKYSKRDLTQEQIERFAKEDLKKEVEDSVQTFNYQTNSMTNTNGQSPFLSVCMYLNETEEYKEELAMLIEEFLKQRIKGFKNEKSVYVTPAFPKLLYILEEDNIHPNSEYWYLTELAARCTAKRMVPDYISEKIMKKLKNGDCYPCMGCRSFLTPDPVNHKYYGRLTA